MDKLNDFINTPMDTNETNLADYADLEEQGDDEYAYAPDVDSAYEDKFHIDDEPHGHHEGGEHDGEDKEVEFDLDEIKNEINSHISSTISKYIK